jgi:cell wall-associated NlpC family hydrolase
MSILIQKRGKRLIFTLSIGLLAACASTPEPTVETVFIKKESTVSRAITNPAKSSGMIALETARKMLGVPYRYGGTDPHGFDCSGLVQYAFSHAGVKLPRSSRDIFRNSQLIDPKNLQAGDLVFFAISKSKVSHVGIYDDRNRFIHAPSSGKGVSYANLESSYWRERLVGAGRF